MQLGGDSGRFDEPAGVVPALWCGVTLRLVLGPSYTARRRSSTQEMQREMAILKIARMGHPILRQVARYIEDATAPDVARLAANLIETCEDIGGNGIAAPQVHSPLRMFVYRVRAAVMPVGASMAEIPWTICINPEIEPLTEQTGLYWERCLSLPGLFGQVARCTKIRFSWTDLESCHHTMIAHRYHARLLQHEFDHLEGVLYPMRMPDMGTFGFVSELGEAAYPNLPRDAADFVDPELDLSA